MRDVTDHICHQAVEFNKAQCILVVVVEFVVLRHMLQDCTLLADDGRECLANRFCQNKIGILGAISIDGQWRIHVGGGIRSREGDKI